MGKISVVILTLNEEVNLADCLDSCAWCDDVVVFDSLSEDKTREIAAQKGARFIERRFDDYARQRNAALTEVSYRNDWVLMLDADERVPGDLAHEMQQAIAGDGNDLCLLRMRRKDIFRGRWLRRSSGYPTWFGRLARVGRVRVERDVNEEFVTDGRVGHLEAHLLHYPFNKGIAHWYERHNRYSTMEARATLAERSIPLAPLGLLSLDPALRRRALKRVFYRLPMRPTLMFLYLYVLRLGFLDGRPGLHFSLMRASYELMIHLKVIEALRRGNGAAV